MKEYPLYPTLSEEAQTEAQLLIDGFKKKLSEAAEEAIQVLYCDVALYIESDSWMNFRNEIMSGFKNYDNRKIQNKWNFKEIRAEIYKEYRSEIIADLNQDIYEENIALKKQIEHLNELIRFQNVLNH